MEVSIQRKRRAEEEVNNNQEERNDHGESNGVEKQSPTEVRGVHSITASLVLSVFHMSVIFSFPVSILCPLSLLVLTIPLSFCLCLSLPFFISFFSSPFSFLFI